MSRNERTKRSKAKIKARKVFIEYNPDIVMDKKENMIFRRAFMMGWKSHKNSLGGKE